MKVKATKDFQPYRCNVLGLEVSKYRELQQGKVVDIDKELYDKRKNLFVAVEKGDSTPESKDPPKKGGK